MKERLDTMNSKWIKKGNEYYFYAYGEYIRLGS